MHDKAKNLSERPNIQLLEHPIPPLSSTPSVTKTVCAMDLGNRASYHRSAGVKTTGKILSIKNILKKSLIIALLRGPKSVKDFIKQAQRAQSRPEGPQPRLLVCYIFEKQRVPGYQISHSESSSPSHPRPQPQPQPRPLES